MPTSFQTRIKAIGNNPGIEVPAANMAELSARKTPAVQVTMGNYSYRSTVAVMGGAFMIPLSAAHRKAAGLQADDPVLVTLELDLEPRTVTPPHDLTDALDRAGVRSAFEKLAFSKQKEFVRQVEEAKAPETRARRIEKIVAGLQGT